MSTLYEARFFGDIDWHEVAGLTEEAAAENFVAEHRKEAREWTRKFANQPYPLIVEVFNPWNRRKTKLGVERIERAFVLNVSYEKEPVHV